MQPTTNAKVTTGVVYSTKTQPANSRLSEMRLSRNHMESIDFSKNVEFSVSNGVVVGTSINKGISLNITPKKIPLETVPQKVPAKFKGIQLPLKSGSLEEIPERYDPKTLLKVLRSSGPITRLFRIWPGNNRFCFNGSLMTGPSTDVTSNCFTWIAIIIIINAVFYAVATPFLWNHVNPFFPILNTYLLCMTIGFLLLTSFTDPGIIPRRGILLATKGEVPERYSGKARRASETLQPFASQNRSPGKKAKTRYCKICQIHRPPRTEHCKECNNCVEMRDTHSSFVNNCVGKRNYKYYMLFLASLVLMGLCILAGLILAGVIYFTSYDGLDNDAINKSTVVIALSCILGIPAALLTCIVGTFCSFCLKNSTKKTNDLSKVSRNKRNYEKASLLSTWCKFEAPLFNPKELLTLDQLTVFQEQRLHDEDADLESPNSGKTEINPEHGPSHNRSPKFKTFTPKNAFE